jgi:hypothetical protein
MYKFLRYRDYKTYGFTSPVLIDGDNRILAGHARTKAAEKMGLAEVPAVVLPLTGAAADAYVIADNKLNELSEWDENILADLVAEIDAANFDIELTGFDPDELDALLSPKGCVEDDFDTEKAKKDVEDKGGAFTQTGDIRLGVLRHTVFGSINKAALGNLSVYVPTADEAAEFESLVRPIDEQIAATSDDSVRLAGLRDTLLPRLMSGELSIADG